MRYILKHTGTAKVTDTTSLHIILNANNATIIDGSMLPQLGMLEIEEKNANRLKTNLGESWLLFPEKKYSVPDTRKRVKR